MTCGQDEPASSAPLWGEVGEINEPQRSHREGAWLDHFRAAMFNRKKKKRLDSGDALVLEAHGENRLPGLA